MKMEHLVPRINKHMNPQVLRGLNFKDFIHPEDQKGLKRMDAVPGVKKLLAETISNLREKFTTMEMMGDGINITLDSYPELYKLLCDAANTLDLKDVPDFSMTWSYDISVGTEGARKPRVTALSGTIDLLNDKELTFMLGHELGHIMAGHKPYHNLLITLYTPLMKMVPHADMWLSVLRPMLLQWYRISDFTADRAGLLTCQDISVALTTMIKRSGIPKKYYDSIKPESILRQAQIFELKNRDLADNLIQNLSINSACAPWLVVRAAMLHRWYKSGEYNDIIQKFSI